MPCCSCCPCLECCCEQQPHPFEAGGAGNRCRWYSGRFFLHIFWIVAVVIFGISDYYCYTYTKATMDSWSWSWDMFRHLTGEQLVEHLLNYSLFWSSFLTVLLTQIAYVMIYYEYKCLWGKALFWTLFIIALIFCIIAIVIVLCHVKWSALHSSRGTEHLVDAGNAALPASGRSAAEAPASGQSAAEAPASGRSAAEAPASQSADGRSQNDVSKKENKEAEGNERRKRQSETTPALATATAASQPKGRQGSGDPYAESQSSISTKDTIKGVCAGALFVILILISHIYQYYVLQFNAEEDYRKHGCPPDSSTSGSSSSDDKSKPTIKKKKKPKKKCDENLNNNNSSKQTIKIFYFSL